jgi:16S rRNA (adenine1518-N6/adenine1519-N6)-dimethyltransferase
MNDKLKIKPEKRLGQNFLSETGVIKKLTNAAKIQSGETILEIGPGTGNLTAELIKTGRPVIAAEKDRRMADVLREKFNKADNFTLFIADALKFDELKIAAPYKIVANLPFYAAAPIIRKFLESRNPPASMSLIVQKEVARRICAQAPKANILANAVQFYAAPKIISYVSKGSFWPVPKVDAAILLLAPRTKEGDRADKKFSEKFFKILKAGFSHPRKLLASNLAQIANLPREKIKVAMADSGIPQNCRPENLSPEDWIVLARVFEL